MRNRAYRRYKKEQKKKLSDKYFNTPKFADNLKSCSCWMCGNPRKYLKERTLQEIRWLYTEDDYI